MELDSPAAIVVPPLTVAIEIVYRWRIRMPFVEVSDC
jgi:hypothetical protein